MGDLVKEQMLLELLSTIIVMIYCHRMMLNGEQKRFNRALSNIVI